MLKLHYGIWFAILFLMVFMVAFFELPSVFGNMENVSQNEYRQVINEDKININKASLIELQSLNGIGEKKAQAIISYREENGPFENIYEITNVYGISDKTFEKFKTYITVF